MTGYSYGYPITLVPFPYREAMSRKIKNLNVKRETLKLRGGKKKEANDFKYKEFLK